MRMEKGNRLDELKKVFEALALRMQQDQEQMNQGQEYMKKFQEEP